MKFQVDLELELFPPRVSKLSSIGIRVRSRTRTGPPPGVKIVVDWKNSNWSPPGCQNCRRLEELELVPPRVSKLSSIGIRTRTRTGPPPGVKSKWVLSPSAWQLIFVPDLKSKSHWFPSRSAWQSKSKERYVVMAPSCAKCYPRVAHKSLLRCGQLVGGCWLAGWLAGWLLVGLVWVGLGWLVG